MLAKQRFIKRLETAKPLVLDGGLSNQLEALGYCLDNPLWSALLLKDDPNAIVQAHLDYLIAGAQVLISASYQASIKGFTRLGLTTTQANALIADSVILAIQAIEQFMQSKPKDYPRPLIAASIGPYGASLADGSEYHGNYGVSSEQLTEFHKSRMTLLDQTQADVLACETIPSMQEALVLAQLLLRVETPAWISFSCKDEAHLNDGSSIEAVAKHFIDHPKVVAIGVNCTAPQYISGLIKRLKSIIPDKAIIVYPNSGEHFHPENKTWSGTLSPESCCEAVSNWHQSGAAIIGGCCRMGPQHIKAMAQILNRCP